MTQRVWAIEAMVAVAVIGAGVVLLTGIGDISQGAGYDRIGPRFFPLLVGLGLVVLGSGLAAGSLVTRRALASDAPPEVSAEGGIAVRPLVEIAAGLVLWVLLVEEAGFVAATALQFVIVARAFRGRLSWTDVAIAVLLSALVFVAFSQGLGSSLPLGRWVESWTR